MSSSQLPPRRVLAVAMSLLPPAIAQPTVSPDSDARVTGCAACCCGEGSFVCVIKEEFVIVGAIEVEAVEEGVHLGTVSTLEQERQRALGEQHALQPREAAQEGLLFSF